MPLTVLNVWNQALGAIGDSTRVDDPAEVSPQAEACSLWYETARDAVFRAAPWSALTAHKRIATAGIRDPDVEWAETDPPPGWTNAFACPSDMVRPRFLSTYEKFVLDVVGDTAVVACNSSTPILTYTRRRVDPAKWDVDLQQAVIFSLAAHIAKKLTGKDSDLNNMYTLANEYILQARVNDANINHEGTQADWLPEWLQARGQNLDMLQQRFIFPSADFVVVGAIPAG